MQTFLPYADYHKTAQCLDNKRLGKQRVETIQILNALRYGKGWIHHPATRMWCGYEYQLLVYLDYIMAEWGRRGYKNDKCIIHFNDLAQYYRHHPKFMPKFIGDEAFHASHRSNLLRKNPSHYGKFGWTEPDNLPYIWP